MEDVLSALHVVGAVFIVGPMAILPMTAMRSVRAGQGGQVAVLAKSTYIFSLLSLLVAILGFGILGVSDHDTSVSTPWVLISIILYVLAVGLTLLAVVPALRSAAEHLQDPAAQELSKPDYRRIAIGSGVTSLLLVVVVVLMSWKPGG
ncbi:DUF2269 family protein [Nakamurella sp. GG22]